MKRLWVFVFSAIFLVLGTCAASSAQTTPQQNTPTPAPQPEVQQIATGRQRISRGNQTVVISRGRQNVTADYFIEMVIVRMGAPALLRRWLTDDKIDPEKLAGETISLSRSTKDRAQWNVFRGGASGASADDLTMAENVFRIQKVLLSTAKSQVKVQIDGQVYRLEPGEVLLLLG